MIETLIIELSLAISSRGFDASFSFFTYLKQGLGLSNELCVKSSDDSSRGAPCPIREEENESRDGNLFRDITNSSPRRITDWL